MHKSYNKDKYFTNVHLGMCILPIGRVSIFRLQDTTYLTVCALLTDGYAVGHM